MVQGLRSILFEGQAVKRVGPDWTVQVRSDVLACEIDGEMVLLHRGKGVYYGLNRSGRALWRWMETPVRVADLCARMAARYGISEERAWEDLQGFLERLWEEELIRVVPPDSP